MIYIGKADFQISNTCVAFGSFEGVHTGHRAVIDKLLETSKSGLTSVVLCFDNHSNQDKILTTTEEKRELLSGSGPEVLISYEIDKPNFSLEQFVKEILADKLGAKVIVTGKNDPHLPKLREYSKKYGFSIEEVETVIAGGEPVSSARIATEIAQGSLEKAIEMLGHPYLMMGEVMHGKALGRTVGMPTANLGVGENKLIPRHGVYATLSTIEEESYKGLTNIGLRPSVDSYQYATIETYLLNFAKDIYGKKLKLEVQGFIRKVQKFDNLEEVKKQVEKDLDFVKTNVKQ
ncbi:MAG: Riboflavin biosynthesis protein [Eubacteriales bacterium]